MKKSLLVFCSVALVTTITVLAYNSDKGPARETDGITELSPRNTDSLVTCGRALPKPLHYSDQDIEAIAAYLNHR